jgi:hypothetical protein
MASKAKTVGQLLAALLKAHPDESVEITWDGDEYVVDFGDEFATGPKMYGALKSIGQTVVDRQDSAIARLRARVGL